MSEFGQRDKNRAGEAFQTTEPPPWAELTPTAERTRRVEHAGSPPWVEPPRAERLEPPPWVEPAESAPWADPPRTAIGGHFARGWAAIPGSGRTKVVVAVAVAVVMGIVAGVIVALVASPSDESIAAAPAEGAPAVVAPPKPQGRAPVANSVAKPTVGPTVSVGPTPGYMEIAPNGRYAYIANRAGGVLSVFDTTRNVVLGTIPVPQGGPQFVSFSPDGSKAYVSIFDNARSVNVVGVLDTKTATFEAMVPVGVRPFALEVTPDGRWVYVPNHDSASITVIDATTNKVTTTIKVAPNPHWVDISKDGTRLYAANHESNVVTTIDTKTNTVLGTVPVGSSPHSIVVVPNKPLVLVANYDSNSISAIDTNSNTVIKTIPTGNHPQDLTFAADAKHLYIDTVDDNAIQVLDMASLEITSSVPTGRSPTSVAVGPGGRQAYVTNLDDGTVTVLNIAGTA
jgi:YVTN family beta-propeller protein